MTNPTIKRGNIFASQCETLVNTVNCDGVMGAGIALEFKLRLPAMFDRYAELCRRRLIDVGKLWIYRPPPDAKEKRWVLNFPTKRRWKHPSKMSYLENGLQKFLDTYQERGITSIAFPLLGATNGGLSEDDSLSVMRHYLDQCDVPVEIYRYDPEAADDLYDEFRKRMLDSQHPPGDKNMAKAMGLRIDLFRKVCAVLADRDDINSLSRLATVKGIGLKTIETCFRHAMSAPGQEQTATAARRTVDGTQAIPAVLQESPTPSRQMGFDRL